MSKNSSDSQIKRLSDGRAMANLGCGTRMNWEWNNIDFSYLGRLRQHMSAARWLHRLGLLSNDRWNRLQAMDPHIILHDLSKGIPFPDDSFDVVYHSQLLEHIDREAAPDFLRECRRVLKPTGILRIVIPDLEQIARGYLEALTRLDIGEQQAREEHQRTINELFDQMVRREGAGTRQQPPLVRALERVFRGDASKAGETHRWMYDRYSLADLLQQVGFRDITQQQADASIISSWNKFGLDLEPDSTAYKPGSLYMEASK
jgi:SAM-dependent methyltransferase